MKNCNSCKHSSYSGGMEGLAERMGVKVEQLHYKYCIEVHEHIGKSYLCEKFKPIETNAPKRKN